MKCFFCIEEINDDAIVCRYCHRDVQHLRLLAARISALEDDVAELQLRVLTSTGGETKAAVVQASDTTRLRYRVLPLLLTIVVICGVTIYDSYYPGVVRAPIVFLIPPLFALWSSLARKGRHTLSYFVDGGVVGVAFLATAILVNHERFDIKLFGFLVASQTLLYATGGLVGDFIERKLLPRDVSAGLPEALASRLLWKRAHRSDDPHEIRLSRRVADFLTAIAPLLTFIASLVTSYLAYRTALSKH